MQITIMGYVLIPIGIILFFLKKEYLLYFIVFFSGFTGSSVINFESISYSLQPAYYFGLLFIIRCIIQYTFRWKVVRPNIILIVFIGICSISLFMPILLRDKNIIILNQDSKYETLTFSYQNITQFLYILFCFIIYWLSKDLIKNDPKIFRKCIRILLWSSLVICILGFIQELSYIYHFEFDKVFRASVHGNIQPYGNFIRVYSVAQEPSMYAYYLVPIIGLTLFTDKQIFKHKTLLIILLLISGIISTSTTFIVGLAMILLIFIFDKLLKINFSKENIKLISKMAVLIIIGFAAVFSLFNLVPQIHDLMTTSVIDKLKANNTSGYDRKQAFIHHFNTGLRYPILGVGFGSARSYDLFSTWLANIGISGIGVFVAFLFNIIFKLKKVNNSDYKNISQGFIYFIISLFTMAFISVAEPYYLFIWVGISLAECVLYYDKKDQLIKVKSF